MFIQQINRIAQNEQIEEPEVQTIPGRDKLESVSEAVSTPELTTSTFMKKYKIMKEKKKQVFEHKNDESISQRQIIII